LQQEQVTNFRSEEDTGGCLLTIASPQASAQSHNAAAPWVVLQQWKLNQQKPWEQ